MATYLIEIPHSENTFENALWGCKAGVHKSWFISGFENKEEALHIIPPFLRHSANIIEVTKFTKADIEHFDEVNRH